MSSLCSDLLPKPPNIFYYLPNGTVVSVRADPVVSQRTHRDLSLTASLRVSPVTRLCVCVQMNCFYHGSVRGFSQSRVALSTCSGLR